MKKSKQKSSLTDDEKIERLWEALMFACMELKGDSADALMHAMHLYNNIAPEMLRKRKQRKPWKEGDEGEPIGTIVARRIMAKWGIPEPGPDDLAGKRRSRKTSNKTK